MSTRKVVSPRVISPSSNIPAGWVSISKTSSRCSPSSSCGTGPCWEKVLPAMARVISARKRPSSSLESWAFCWSRWRSSRRAGSSRAPHEATSRHATSNARTFSIMAGFTPQENGLLLEPISTTRLQPKYTAAVTLLQLLTMTQFCPSGIGAPPLLFLSRR